MANESAYPSIDFLRQMAFDTEDMVRKAWAGQIEFKLKSDNTPVSTVDEAINGYVLLA